MRAGRPSEEKIVHGVAKMFTRKGFCYQKREVQFCERFIDLVCWNRKGNKIVAIEAKVNAPSRAFAQARRYRYIANYVYVAVFKNGCNKKAVELSKKSGIGLIFVDRDSRDDYFAEIAIKPKKSLLQDKKLVKYAFGGMVKNLLPLIAM